MGVDILEDVSRWAWDGRGREGRLGGMDGGWLYVHVEWWSTKASNSCLAAEGRRGVA